MVPRFCPYEVSVKCICSRVNCDLLYAPTCVIRLTALRNVPVTVHSTREVAVVRCTQEAFYYPTMTPEQITNWRSVLAVTMGPMAFILPDEQIQVLRDVAQNRINQEEAHVKG